MALKPVLFMYVMYAQASGLINAIRDIGLSVPWGLVHNTIFEYTRTCVKTDS